METIINFVKDYKVVSSIITFQVLTFTYYLYNYATLPERTNEEECEENRAEDYRKNIPEDILKKIDLKNMKHYWYPVEISSKITKDKPQGITLLEEPLVLYRDSNGKVICAQDLCPHRSAKLSLGNMRDGNLECQYHGWQFGADGNCKRVPSVSKTSKFSEEICLNTKPCVEDLNLIWVWIGPKELAHESLIPRYVFRERGFNGWKFIDSSTDLDLRHDLMVDNLMDVAHLDFTHDGYLGKRSLASYVQYNEIKEHPYLEANPESFCYTSSKPELESPDYFGIDPKSKTNCFTFVPPCFVKLKTKFPSGKLFVQTFAMIPLTKTKMRLIQSFDNELIPRPIIEYIIPLGIVGYFTKRQSDTILYQDYEMLKGINNNTDLGAPEYSKIVGADIMIKRYRNWYLDAIKKTPWFQGFKVKDIEDL
eukprot:gene773-9023_t